MWLNVQPTISTASMDDGVEQFLISDFEKPSTSNFEIVAKARNAHLESKIGNSRRSGGTTFFSSF